MRIVIRRRVVMSTVSEVLALANGLNMKVRFPDHAVELVVTKDIFLFAKAYSRSVVVYFNVDVWHSDFIGVIVELVRGDYVISEVMRRNSVRAMRYPQATFLYPAKGEYLIRFRMPDETKED